MVPKAAPQFISRAGIAKLADLSVDEVRALHDANELPPADAVHLDMHLARPLWLFETIEPWIRARWPDDDDDDRSAGEKLASPPPIEDLGYYGALRHGPLHPG